MGGRKDLITAGLTLGALADAKAKAKGKMSAIIATESGSAVSFTAADAAPVADLTAAIVPVQSGSGDPSPENIRPISGFTGINVTRAGKNMLDVNTYPIVDGSYVNYITGKITANTGFSCITGFIPCNHLQGLKVTLNKNGGGYNPGIAFYKKSNVDSFLSGVSDNGAIAGTPITFTIPTDANFMRMTVAQGETDFQLELGSAATAYEPYRGDTYTVTFGSAGTVYGGTLDVTTGTLTVTMAEVDLGTLDYLKTGSSSNPVFSTRTIPNIKPNASSSSLANAICSAYKQVNYAGLTADGTFCVIWAASSAAGKAYFKNMAYDDDDAAAFKAAMSGVQLVYELATPIVYHLTPVEIRTLVGQNTIWADTGDVTVKYATTDTKAFIDKYIAERRNG